MYHNFKDLLSCGEFIKLCGITKNALVWYEKKGLLKPTFIGKNGYHYYSREQFFEIDLIKSLKAADKTLNEIRSYSNHRDYNAFIQLLRNQQSVLRQKYDNILHQLNLIDNTLNDCLTMQEEFTLIPVCKTYRTRHLLIYPLESDSEKEYLYSFKLLFDKYREYRLSPSMMNGTIIQPEQDGSYKRTHVFLTANAQIDSEFHLILPEGTYVVCYYPEGVSGFIKCHQSILDFVQRKNLKIDSNIYEFDYINYLMTSNSKERYKKLLLRVKPR